MAAPLQDRDRAHQTEIRGSELQVASSQPKVLDQSCVVTCTVCVILWDSHMCCRLCGACQISSKHSLHAFLRRGTRLVVMSDSFALDPQWSGLEDLCSSCAA